MSRDKELEVGFRSVTNGNFVRREREFKHEQLCHKAVLKIFLWKQEVCFLWHILGLIIKVSLVIGQDWRGKIKTCHTQHPFNFHFFEFLRYSPVSIKSREKLNH